VKFINLLTAKCAMEFLLRTSTVCGVMVEHSLATQCFVSQTERNLVAPPCSNVREARLKTDKISVYAAVEIWSIEDIPKPLICSP